MNCFAAGIFISMALIHILPEAVEMHVTFFNNRNIEHDDHHDNDHSLHDHNDEHEHDHDDHNHNHEDGHSNSESLEDSHGDQDHDHDHNHDTHGHGLNNDHSHDEHDHDSHLFPLPYLLVFLGYSLMLFLDKILSPYVGSSNNQKPN